AVPAEPDVGAAPADGEPLHLLERPRLEDLGDRVLAVGDDRVAPVGSPRVGDRRVSGRLLAFTQRAAPRMQMILDLQPSDARERIHQAILEGAARLEKAGGSKLRCQRYWQVLLSPDPNGHTLARRPRRPCRATIEARVPRTRWSGEAVD